MSVTSKLSSKKKFGAITIDVDPYRAISEGDMRLLKFSLEEDGFKINSCKWSGWTLLHRAAELGREDIVNLLLDYGADPNISSTWGWHTPLHLALGRGHLDVAVTLVDRGADQFKKNKYKQNATMVANARGMGGVVKEFKAEVIRRDIARYKATIEQTKQQFKERVHAANSGGGRE